MPLEIYISSYHPSELMMLIFTHFFTMTTVCGHAKHQHCHQVADGVAAVWMTFHQDELVYGNKTTCLVPGATTSPRMLTKTKNWFSVFEETGMLSVSLLICTEEIPPRKSSILAHNHCLPTDKEAIVYIDFSKAIIQNPSHFTRAIVASQSTDSFMVWYDSYTISDCKALQRVMKSAHHIIRSLPPLSSNVYKKCCMKKERSTISDPVHPRPDLFTLLSSSK